MWSAAFTVVGPEYVSMVAGETKLPRRYLKNAFKATYARFAFDTVFVAIVVEACHPKLGRLTIVQIGPHGLEFLYSVIDPGVVMHEEK